MSVDASIFALIKQSQVLVWPAADEFARVWRMIAALEGDDDLNSFWGGIAESANDGNVPSGAFSGWDNCAKLWPVKHRKLVVPLLNNPHRSARVFAANLISEWGMCPFDDVLLAFAQRHFDEELLRLLPRSLTPDQTARLIDAFNEASDPDDCARIVEWICAQRVSSLYKKLLHDWLAGAHSEATVTALYERAKSVRSGDWGLPRTVYKRASSAALNLLGSASQANAKKPFRVLVKCGSAEDVAKGLRNQGAWLDTAAITQFFQQDGLPDNLAVALARVWRRSPSWWRRQLEAAWRNHAAERLVEGCRFSPNSLQGLIPAAFYRPPWQAQVGGDDTSVDFETLQPLPRFLGMPLADRVITIEVDRLRFAFLVEESVTRRRQSATGWFIRQKFSSRAGIEQLLADERLCDEFEMQWVSTVADAFAQMERPIWDDLWEALDAVRGWIWRDDLFADDEQNEDFPLEPAFDLPGLNSLFRRLQEKALPEYRAARSRLIRQSREWTERLAGMSGDEFPLRFPRLRWEGVLGEYYWKAQTILLYPLMAEWLARDIGRSVHQPADVVARAAYSATVAHEAVHAIMHLGLDDQGRHWANPGEASPAFHESLTHWLTRAWLVPRSDAAERAVFAEFEKRLPSIYRMGRLLPDASAPQALESVRRHLLRRGGLSSLPDPVELAVRVVGAAHRAILGLHSSRVGDAGVSSFPLPGPMSSADELTLDEVFEYLAWFLKTLAVRPLVWREIVLSDAELMQFLMTPHLADCALFCEMCRSDVGASDSFQALYKKDVEENIDLLVSCHRKEELNQLQVKFNALHELWTMVIDRSEQSRATEPEATDGRRSPR